MTDKENQIEIPLAKSKLILMLTGSFVFVIGGFYNLNSRISSK